MRRFALFLILIVAAGCTQQARPELPEGVTCPEESWDIIMREGLDPQADPNSDEYSVPFALGFYNTIGCDMPLPDLEDL